MVGDIVSWIAQYVADPSVHQVLTEYDKLVQNPDGKDYLLRSTRLWRDIGHEIRSAPTRFFSESDLEKIIRNMMPAAVLGTVMHFGEKRKDGTTDYIEHPAGVAKAAILACLYDEDEIPEQLAKIADKAGKKGSYRKELLKTARIESKLDPIHDTAEHWREKYGGSRQDAVDQMLDRYASLSPDDPDIGILKTLLYHITPSGEHFFRDIDEAAGIEDKMMRAYLFIAKANDRVHNTEDNEYHFDLDARINNLIKNLYVANTIKQFLKETDPHSNVRKLPFGIKIPFDVPFLSPEVPAWYFPLLQSYNDLLFTSEIECRLIRSAVFNKMSEYAAALNSPKGRRQGLIGRTFKKRMGRLIGEVDKIFDGKDPPAYLQVSDDRRTTAGREREMYQLASMVISTSKMPSQESLRRALTDGIYSVFGQQVTSSFDPMSSKEKDLASPDVRMAQLVTNYFDASFLRECFRLLGYENNSHIRNLDRAA